MRIKLSLKDKKLNKKKEVNKWLRKCEKLINKGLADYFWIQTSNGAVVINSK